MKNKSFGDKGKIILALAIALFMALMANAIFAADKYPSPRGAVNDFANVIDQDNAVKMKPWRVKFWKKQARRLLL